MAGLLKLPPRPALIKALREETDLPIHLHTHDTSGAAAATLIAAVDAGVDAIDGAIDAMSGTTSQPCLGSVVEALRNTPRDTRPRQQGDPRAELLLGGGAHPICRLESDLKSGASEVYLHEMPGGQFTTCASRPAASVATRWHEGRARLS